MIRHVLEAWEKANSTATPIQLPAEADDHQYFTMELTLFGKPITVIRTEINIFGVFTKKSWEFTSSNKKLSLLHLHTPREQAFAIVLAATANQYYEQRHKAKLREQFCQGILRDRSEVLASVLTPDQAGWLAEWTTKNSIINDKHYGDTFVRQFVKLPRLFHGHLSRRRAGAFVYTAELLLKTASAPTHKISTSLLDQIKKSAKKEYGSKYVCMLWRLTQRLRWFSHLLQATSTWMRHYYQFKPEEVAPLAVQPRESTHV